MISKENFLTIESQTIGLYREKGSKFLSFAYPVTTEEEIKQHLALLKKEYFDASHHCFAWVLGADHARYRAFDDGEPNHSAGDPILGQIRSNQLTNILIVVVRYFGGTKLGVGGLISAYKLAAADCIKNAVIITKDIKVIVDIEYNYSDTPEIMKLIKQFDLQILDQSFESQCYLKAEVKVTYAPLLKERIQVLISMGLAIKFS